MHLVQVLLPLADNAGAPFGAARFDSVRRELTGHFGGVTAYTRSPGEGEWRAASGGIARDEVVIYEVMIDDLDRVWWQGYRHALEIRFAQEEIIVRACRIERL